MHSNEHGQPIGFPVLDWTTAGIPDRTPMRGLYTELHAVTNIEPFAALYAAYKQDTNGLNWTYLPYGPFEKLDQFIAWLEAACFQDDPLFHVVHRKGATDNTGSAKPLGDAIGMASFLRINPGAGSIEVGHIHFSPLLQRTPVASEAMFLMMRRVFDELGYRRYEWKCDALNEPSKRAATRFGFIYEGTFRQALTYKQRNRDTAWFSITDKEWPLIKAGYECWLQPENFGVRGEQIKTLKACRAEAGR